MKRKAQVNRQTVADLRQCVRRLESALAALQATTAEVRLWLARKQTA